MGWMKGSARVGIRSPAFITFLSKRADGGEEEPMDRGRNALHCSVRWDSGGGGGPRSDSVAG